MSRAAVFYSIDGGNPVRLTESRFLPGAFDAPSVSEWWTWSDEQLRDRIDMFFDVDAFVETFG